jgi:hypothetical protein
MRDGLLHFIGFYFQANLLANEKRSFENQKKFGVNFLGLSGKI